MARLSPPVVLGLDLGTSSVRAILHDGRGRPLGPGVHEPYSPRVRADGTAEVPLATLTRLTEACIDGVLTGCRHEVAAVGMSTFWHGLVGSRGGRAVTPVLLWSDTRSWEQAEQLRRALDPEAVRQRTGCPIHPSYWPAKLAWARALGIEAETWCSPADLLLQRWFGELATSLSMASATGLYELDGSGWAADLAERVGVRAGSLPPVSGATHRLPPRLARRWPQLASAVFVPPAGDGALANLGSGCIDSRRRALTVGTSGALRVMTERPPARLPAGLWCYRLDGRRVIVGGSFSNGGNLHAWILDTLRVDERALERRLRLMEPASTGLVFLPLLAGERSPGFAPRASGGIAGLTLATTAEEIARAGLEGVAVRFALVDERLDEALPGVEHVVGSGAGLVRSRAFTQLMADALGRRVLAAGIVEASARGAAIFALEHLGVVSEAAHELPRGRTFSPRAAATEAYRGLREPQAALYRALVLDHIAEGRSPAHLRRPGAKRSNGG